MVTRQFIKNRWCSQESSHSGTQYTLNFDHELIPFFNNHPQVLLEIFDESLHQEIINAKCLIFKINPSAAELFFLFMNYLINHRTNPNSPTFINLAFQNLTACKIDIRVNFPVTFSADNMTLVANRELIANLARSEMNFSIILHNCKELIKKSPLLKELKLKFCNQFILNLQRAPRVVMPDEHQEMHEAVFETQQAFADLLKNTPLRIINFLYHLEAPLKALDGLHLVFNKISFKGKFEYLMAVPGQNFPLVVSLSGGEHLAQALSKAINLKNFSLKHQPKEPKSAGGDLSPVHIASLFRKWREARIDNYQLLSCVKIEIPVYEHLWIFYSKLLTEWEVKILLFNLKSRYQPEKQAHFLTMPATLSQIMTFGLNIQQNKTLESLTFFADMPHKKHPPKELISFVRAIARNFTLSNLNLQIDNTLGFKMYTWRLQVIKEFRGQPTLKSIVLFGTGSEILDSLLTTETSVEKEVWQAHYAIQLYQQNKPHLLRKAEHLVDLEKHLSSDLYQNIASCPRREGYRILASASFQEFVVMAHIYYRNIARESMPRAILFKAKELWYVFSKIPLNHINLIALKDCFKDIAEYLSDKDLCSLFVISGGLFNQLEKMIIIEPQHIEPPTPVSSSTRPLLFSNAASVTEAALQQSAFTQRKSNNRTF